MAMMDRKIVVDEAPQKVLGRFAGRTTPGQLNQTARECVAAKGMCERCPNNPIELGLEFLAVNGCYVKYSDKVAPILGLEIKNRQFPHDIDDDGYLYDCCGICLAGYRKPSPYLYCRKCLGEIGERAAQAIRENGVAQ